MSQCEFRKQSGERCQAAALHGSRLCFSHDPAAAEKKRAAVVKGGRNRRYRRATASAGNPVVISSVSDVKDLLFCALAELRTGTLEVDVARTIGYLGGVATKVAEAAELERRVTELERRLVAYADRVGSPI